MKRPNKFERNIINCNRYKFYGKEAKNTLKEFKKLDEAHDRYEHETEQFFNQLIKLCVCKNDNILLSELGQDIAIVRANYHKINVDYKKKFTDLINQLAQIAEQYDGIDKIESKYKEVHKKRIKHQQKSQGICRLLFRAISFKAQQNDNLNDLSNYHLTSDYKQSMDLKLTRLLNDEAQIEEKLRTHCLNYELSTLIRIRKLVRLFAENRIVYERDLLTLFSELELATEGGVPEAIFELDNQDLEQYFRPKRRSVPTLERPETRRQDRGAEKIDRNSYFQNSNKLERSCSIDTYKDKINEMAVKKSPELTVGQRTNLNRRNLYYGSLCGSLKDQLILDQTLDKNRTCQICNQNLLGDQNPNSVPAKGQRITQQDVQIVNQNLNQNFVEPQVSNTVQVISPNNHSNEKKNPFLEKNYHKCEMNHSKSVQSGQFDFTLASISPTASAPPIEDCIETSFQNQLMINTTQSNNKSIEQKPIEQSAIERNPNLIRNPNNGNPSWLNQAVFCQECRNYQSKVEEAALTFVNNYRCFRNKIECCENHLKQQQQNDQLPQDYPKSN